MQSVRDSLGKSFVVMLLAVSLFLTLTLSEAHAHPADDTHSHASDAAHEDGTQDGTPVVDHAGCHATPFLRRRCLRVDEAAAFPGVPRACNASDHAPPLPFIRISRLRSATPATLLISR